jgi:uncharacterized membrane protein YidH (DUF202 family)
LPDVGGSWIYDKGLQPERTILAWRRTGLAIAVGGCFAARLMPEALGAWSLAVGLLVLVCAAATLVAAERRFRRMLADLRTTGALAASGPLVSAVAFASGLLSAGALAYVALLAVR